SPDYNSNAEGIRFSSWALPGSLAVTKGILLTVASLADDFHFGHPVGYLERHWEARIRTFPILGAGRLCVTPRQTCPQPNGFRRNLRSKTRWFTGFCNSHQVSHFATFFIDARAEISVAESHYSI
ncbi:hypothetical protein LINPERHAP1_LOCUS40357, partial [Linum perenne]